MFEKEAEEYAEINKPFLNRYDCVCVFKDGAEFGYNKAKEEMQENGLALQSDMDKTIEQNIQLKNQIEKMKCCANCKFDNLEPPEVISNGVCENCINHCKWKLED